MAKLQDLFSQARRAQNGGSMGFLGKNKAESKAHAAALVIEFNTVINGGTEAALKAGADGVLFNWDGSDTSVLQAIKQEVESAKSLKDALVSGIRITGNLDQLNREQLNTLKDNGIQYIILPFNAPARLLTIETKEVEKVVTVPMRSDEMYALSIRNLASFHGIAAVFLDFHLDDNLATLSIEDILNYHAVREAVRFPAFIVVKGDLTEEEAYTLATLGVQAVVLNVSDLETGTQKQIKSVRTHLEKLQEEEKEKDTPSYLHK